MTTEYIPASVMISSLLLLAASRLLGVLSMYGGRRVSPGNPSTSQGFPGEQSDVDDHTPIVSGIQNDQVYKHDLSGEDDLIPNSTSSGLMGQHTGTEYDLFPSQPMVYEDNYHHFMASTVHQGSHLEDALGIPQGRQSGPTTHSGQHQGEVSQSNRLQQSPERLSLEAELESIISSTRNAELTKPDHSTSSSVLPSSNSQTYSPAIYENFGQARQTSIREGGVQTQDYPVNLTSVSYSNANLLQHQETAGFPIRRQSSYYQGLERPSSSSQEYFVAGRDRYGRTSIPGQLEGHFTNRSHEYPFNIGFQPGHPPKRRRVPESSLSGNFQGLPHHLSSSQSQSGIGRHRSDQSLEAPMSGHPEAYSANSSQVTSLNPNHTAGRFPHTYPSSAIRESSRNRGFHGIVLPSSSSQSPFVGGPETTGQPVQTARRGYTHPPHVYSPNPASWYQFDRNYSETNTVLATNSKFPGMLLKSSGKPVNQSFSQEFYNSQVSMLDSLGTSEKSCGTATLENVKYTVCLTDMWSTLDLSIEFIDRPKTGTERVTCTCAPTTAKVVNKISRGSSSFKFTCAGVSSGLHTFVNMSLASKHIIFVGHTNAELRGEWEKGNTWWFPPTKPFIVTGPGKGSALCAAIPLFIGSIGLVALKKVKLGNIKDSFTRTTFSKVPEAQLTQIDQFD